MRRLARWTLRAAAIGGLLLAVGVGVSWPISYRHSDFLFVDVGLDETLVAASGRGRLSVGFVARRSTDRFETRRYPIDPARRESADPPGSRLGFFIGGNAYNRYMMMPTPAALGLLLGVAAFAWLAAGRSRRRSDVTRCRRCNYDLRATPARCPECGEPARATGA